jgi:hypothetical protein
MKYDYPVDVSVKILTSSRNAKDVFDFFLNVKNWEWWNYLLCDKR